MNIDMDNKTNSTRLIPFQGVRVSLRRQIETSSSYEESEKESYSSLFTETSFQLHPKLHKIPFGKWPERARSRRITYLDD